MEDDHVENVLAVIRQNRRLTVPEVARSSRNLYKSSCLLILTEKRKLRRVTAKFVTRHPLSMNF